MPRIDVVSTTRVMQDGLYNILGFGCIYTRSKNKPGEKVQYAWAIWSAPVVGPLLSVVGPYLVVKRDVAHVVQGFCESRLVHDLEPYSEYDLAALRQVRQLNKRGK